MYDQVLLVKAGKHLVCVSNWKFINGLIMDLTDRRDRKYE